MPQGGSNTDSGSKSGVYYRDNRILYLAFIIRNLFKIIHINNLIIYRVKKRDRVKAYLNGGLSKHKALA